MSYLRWLFAVLAASLATACAIAKPPATDAERVQVIETLIDAFRPRFEGVPEVRAPELVAQLKAGTGPVLVDVRDPKEQAVSMLPGAILASEIEANPSAYAHRQLVAYCTIGYRSSEWAQAQQARGLSVANLHGGVLAWTHANGPLEHQREPTRSVHVYGSTWNLAHSGYTATW